MEKKSEEEIGVDNCALRIFFFFFLILIRSPFFLSSLCKQRVSTFRYNFFFVEEWNVVTKGMDGWMFINERASWIFWFEKLVYVSGASLIDSFCRGAEWKIDPFLWRDNILAYPVEKGEGREKRRTAPCKEFKRVHINGCFFGWS